MKIAEIIQRIQSLYSKGVQSDDSRLTARHIYNKMLTVRAKLISQEAKKKQKISQWNYQTIPCVELVKASTHECPCLPPIGCSILKTKYPLPKPMVDLNQHLIQSVTSIDGSIVYSEVSWTEKKYKGSNKYTGNKPDYFIRNEYLYITHRKGPKIIAITGLFDDPLEAENYPSYCPDEDCNGKTIKEDCGNCGSYLDKDFPIDNDLVDTLIEMSVNELVILFSKGMEDLTNNTQDNIPEQSK